MIDIYFTDFHLGAQTALPTLSGCQGFNRCIQYLSTHPHKPIIYTYYSYDESNVIRLTWSVNQVEDYTTQKNLE